MGRAAASGTEEASEGWGGGGRQGTRGREARSEAPEVPDGAVGDLTCPRGREGRRARAVGGDVMRADSKLTWPYPSPPGCLEFDGRPGTRSGPTRIRWGDHWQLRAGTRPPSQTGSPPPKFRPREQRDLERGSYEGRLTVVRGPFDEYPLLSVRQYLI